MLQGVHRVSGADMDRVERHAELVSNEAVGVDLQALRPFWARLSPGGELVGPAHLPQAIDQDTAHVGVFGVNLGERGWTTVSELLTRLMEKCRGDAFGIHAEALGLRSGIAGKEFVRHSALPGHGRNCLYLIERVDNTGDLEVAPGVTSAAADSLVKQVEQGILVYERSGGNGGDPTDQAVFGIVQEILGHGLVTEAVGDAEMDVRVECTRENNFALHIDLTLRLTQRDVGADRNDLFPFDRYPALDYTCWRDH